MAEKRPTQPRMRDAAQERVLQTARSARERGREIKCAALDMPWARCAPARVRPRDDPVGLLRPRDGLVRPPPDRGPRGLRRPQAAGHLRREPLEPHGHADDPAGAAAPVAPADGGRRRGRLLLPQALGRGRACRCCSPRCRSRAAAAGWTRAPPTTCTASWASAGTSCCIRRAPARATARAASCTPGPRSSPPPTTSRSSRSTCRGRARRCRPAARGRAACAPGAPFRRQPICVRFGPPISALPGEHRNETMARVQGWFDAQEGIVPTGAPLAPSAVASAEDRPMTHRRLAVAATARLAGTSAPPANPGPGR